MPNSDVLYNPVLVEALSPVDDSRVRKRAALTGGHEGPVVGFWEEVISVRVRTEWWQRLPPDQSLFLLHAGPSRLDTAQIAERSRDLGNLADVTELLDVIDVLLVPSQFDPFPLVVAEAAGRGVPSLVTRTVGSTALVVHTGAGAVCRIRLRDWGHLLRI